MGAGRTWTQRFRRFYLIRSKTATKRRQAEGKKYGRGPLEVVARQPRFAAGANASPYLFNLRSAVASKAACSSPSTDLRGAGAPGKPRKTLRNVGDCRTSRPESRFGSIGSRVSPALDGWGARISVFLSSSRPQRSAIPDYLHFAMAVSILDSTCIVQAVSRT